MLQNLRSRNGTLLGDMANYEYCHTIGFCHFQQRCCALPDLRNPSGCRVQSFAVHCLDRVYDNQIRLMFLDLTEDVFEQCFAVDHTLLVMHPEAFGPHLDLLRRFLARDIQRAQSVIRKGYLEA